jgi:hypothetical protein
VIAPQNEREILMNLGKFNGSLWEKENDTSAAVRTQG